LIVTINGVPPFQLALVAEDDDLIGRLLAENARFRRGVDTK
jgi:hypothetical protein